MAFISIARLFSFWASKAVDAPYHLYDIGLIALIFATAALSYEFVEKPILRLKGGSGRGAGDAAGGCWCISRSRIEAPTSHPKGEVPAALMNVHPGVDEQ